MSRNLINQTTTTQYTQRQSLFEEINESKLFKKLVYCTTLTLYLVVAFFLCSRPWIVLYIYTVAYPILFIIRVYRFTAANKGLYLLDPCYWGNLFTLIVIWGIPFSQESLQIQFGISNGPLVYAVFPFRNALVMHDIDKVTSVFIHQFPPLISFCLRWYEPLISSHWYTPFSNATEIAPEYYSYSSGAQLGWLIGVPIAFLTIHQLSYTLIIRMIIKPGDKYQDSFAYLQSRDDVIGRLIKWPPEPIRPAFYAIVLSLVVSVMILTSWLFYAFFLAHSILLALQMLYTVWYAASYYVVYYPRKSISNSPSPSLSPVQNVIIPIQLPNSQNIGSPQSKARN